MIRRIIGLSMIAMFIIALIAFCIYKTGNFWSGLGVFFLSVAITAFVVGALFLIFYKEE